MNKTIAKKLNKHKTKLLNRLNKNANSDPPHPVFRSGNIHYDMGDRTQGTLYGGIGAMQMLIKRLGLEDEINHRLQIFKIRNPYFESDHILNIAYNILCNGENLEDIERLRNDTAYLDALGAQRIPDPTTAGDFCRRFNEAHIELLQDIINDIRVKVWQQQPVAFFEEAIIDADGTIAETTGQCKEGMDLSYKGIWGYHPLVVSLANTSEPLFLVNRSGNSKSCNGAAEYLDRAILLCQKVGFKKIRLRGDTDFSQTKYLDDWDFNDVTFVFGLKASPNMVEIAECLPDKAWKVLHRPPKYDVETKGRQKPENVKAQVVTEREFLNKRLYSERVAEFEYKPGKCKKNYRIVVLEKNISVEKGEECLIDEIVYFFYITNDRISSIEGIVWHSNKRCNQENLIDQLKNGAYAMRMPVDNLVSNWAYMVMTSLAWSMKAWYALMLPEEGRWKEKYQKDKKNVLTMSFKTFRNYLIMIPCQIVKTGRKLLYRLLGWNHYLDIFFRAIKAINQPLRC